MGAVNFSSKGVRMNAFRDFYTSSHSTRRLARRADGGVIPETSLSSPILIVVELEDGVSLFVNGNRGEMRNIAEYGMQILRKNCELPCKISFCKKLLF